LLQPAPAGDRPPIAYALSPRNLSRNRAELLSGGAEAFPQMLEAIAGARREVLLESYIIGDDPTGRAFLDALADAARRGCEVRLIGDGVGCLMLPDARLAELSRAGGHAVIYRPVAPWRPRWGLWRRDHRKILVVDGATGFLGGLNLADEYDERRDVGHGWRDLHLRLDGAAAEALAQLFLRTWNAECEPRYRVSRHARFGRAAGLEPPEGIPVEIVGNSELRSRWRIRRCFLHAVKRATRTVSIANPYFIPDGAVVRALVRAVRRGCDVRVVVPARSDVLLCDLAARAVFPRLLRGGVRIAEWQHGMMHAKAAAVDERWATVGSYNLDRRSLAYNLEVTAHLLDAPMAARIERQLREDFDASVELDVNAVGNRPLLLRCFEFLAYQLRSWL
jgi:cardiolipin synthase